MFANILYMLVALVIYSTADLFGQDKTAVGNAWLNTLFVSTAFLIICRSSFRRLARQAELATLEYIDHRVSIYINRLSMLALGVFALIIYGFHLNQMFSDMQLFQQVPTLKAVMFLMVFVLYLVCIWMNAYDIQKRTFPKKISRGKYVLSNIMLSLPALLPWLIISLASDFLMFLPWPAFKNFITSPIGEFSFLAFIIVAVALLAPLLIKKFWRCKPLPPGVARGRIEEICRQTGLEYSDILVWNLFGGAMITAGVMGLVGRVRYILVTPALLSSLRPDELDAVMLHEIGHVQKHHMIFYLLFFSGYMACNFVLFEPALYLLYIFQPAYDFLSMLKISKSDAYAIMLSTTIIGSFILYFRFVFGYFMRNFERQADIHLYKYTADASSLISTFYKIAAYSRQAMEKPNWHHFSVGQRIRFLERCQSDPSAIQLHHTKIKKMMTGYLIIVLIIFSIGYSINYGPAKSSFEQFVFKHILLQDMDIDPENADLYTMVALHFQSKKSYQKAIDVYENILRVAPDNVVALNNLAWLFATCEERIFRNNEKALDYASRAVALKREDFILDTYAEALFVNNDVQSAVAVAKEALGAAKGDKQHFIEQLQRFEKALDLQNTES